MYRIDTVQCFTLSKLKFVLLILSGKILVKSVIFSILLLVGNFPSQWLRTEHVTYELQRIYE